MDERFGADETGYGSGDPYGYSGVSSEPVDPFGDAAAGGVTNDPYATTSDPFGSSPFGSGPYVSEAPDWSASSAAASSSTPYGPALPASAAYASTAVPGHPYAPSGAQGVWAPAQPYTSATPPTSGMAIAALVLGLLSITTCGGLTSLPGLICAIVGMRETGPTGTRSGRGLAVAGLVASIVGFLILLVSTAYMGLMLVIIVLDQSPST